MTEESNAEAADVGHHLHGDIDVLKQYQINTKNMESFLDVAPTDDNYYHNINKELNRGCSNGLAYVDDGYGAVLKIQFVKKGYRLPKEDSTEEDQDTKGKEAHEIKVTQTGRLGDVMRESLDVVKIAVFNYI